MNTILTGRILRKSNNWIRCFRLSWTTANGGSLPHKICQRQQPGFPQAAFLSKPNTCLNMSHLNFSTTGYQQNVQHDRENKRFFIEIQNVGTAYLEYDLDDKLIKLMHTTVPTALGGRGLGKILAKEALDFVSQNDLQLEIHCEFVQSYVSKYAQQYLKDIKE